MNRLVHTLFLVPSLLVLFMCPCVAQEQDELGRKLGAVDALRTGVHTPLKLIQSQCEALLKEHTAPEEQGRIYYQLVKTYAQARMSVNGNALKVIEFAQKGLKCPLDADLRLRLYVYWGDAIILSDISRPISDSRAAAAVVYLQGLREAKQYDLPDVPPERPSIFRPKPGMDEQTFKRERQAHFKELRRIDYVRTLCEDRAVLERQLLNDYSREPYAPEELRKLATEVLGPGPNVEELMSALATKRDTANRRSDK